MLRNRQNETRWIGVGLAILLSLSLFACTQPQASPLLETPLSSPEEIPTESVERVVALTSLSADILQRLDASKLVGIPGSSLLEKDPRFADITPVSQGQTAPSLEKIIALKPDLVIGATGFHDQIAARLTELNIETYLVSLESWESLEALTEAIASAINADPQPLLNQYQTFIPSSNPPGPTTLILASTQPILSPNKNSWSGDFLSQLNFENITANLQDNAPISGYITLSPEKLLQIDPDVLIVIQFANQSPLKEWESNGFWSQLKAVKTQQVHVFDYYGLINPGTIDSIQNASEQLLKIRAVTGESAVIWDDI
ncbi:MAG: ABC transporter substrate-binding protein [Roseofilum sp. SBFL]|uniref:ABC transporter substrate-binding protein n=1 Tax=unclassified Roseofilum TaxID=2620099 RepID=UPI001AFE1084|nr:MULTISPECIES: ABC transporter substrate-binding protein [unclassified Roseofilum]MBP0015157.1 ABC transporter substrate-binding protein [Roseofilum sp. SID3]MBP0023949.1 ABC transporter substrate-binding protein [Roseofilum sp. SID2]MBP0039199.1 ABC transporter substrate-binding protein [Roseofilum sp. SID1]MBP0043287.1 ABC transporter substrate-binding protein [Roseofilum sp. SBFL]